MDCGIIDHEKRIINDGECNASHWLAPQGPTVPTKASRPLVDMKYLVWVKIMFYENKLASWLVPRMTTHRMMNNFSWSNLWNLFVIEYIRKKYLIVFWITPILHFSHILYTNKFQQTKDEKQRRQFVSFWQLIISPPK